ncbi:MAG: phage tail sheath family protein [Armatimonadetes bacterium]|nr:phage tail sheath family protein [Armatimonadota bacterium]
MPGSYTYPGVYVEEIPSGVRTIAGVSTSDTAFIDFFAKGPVDEAVRIGSFGDFGRIFGGLDVRSEAGYAIQQYYLNGGQTAWVVRVAPGNPDRAELTLQGGSPPQDTLTLTAASPGLWGNSIQAAVTRPAGTDRFNLFAREVAVINGRQQVLVTEVYRNLSMSTGDARYAVDVVNAASELIQVADAGLGEVPAGVAPTASGGAPESAFASLENGSDGNAVDVDGTILDASAFTAAVRGEQAAKTGLYALERIDPFIFNLLCIPAAARLGDGNFSQIVADASAFCEDRRAFLLVDIPSTVDTKAKMIDWMADNDTLRHRNAAVYFPRLEIPDTLSENRPKNVGASGTLAGVYARIDAARGIWKAPAGTEAVLRGARLAVKLSDLENGDLNPLGINALRTFPIFGNVAWGSRTMEGADQQASEWKYVPVRRMALYIEESLFQGLKWVVFEPNDEPLWAQIRLNVGAFMHNLFRQGAFQGKTPAEAYFVKCDKETTTQNDIDRGIVNIVVGFAPLRPAEFVVIKLQQMAGQIEA